MKDPDMTEAEFEDFSVMMEEWAHKIKLRERLGLEQFEFTNYLDDAVVVAATALTMEEHRVHTFSFDVFADSRDSALIVAGQLMRYAGHVIDNMSEEEDITIRWNDPERES